jgi:hypothetical protein
LRFEINGYNAGAEKELEELAKGGVLGVCHHVAVGVSGVMVKRHICVGGVIADMLFNHFPAHIHNIIVTRSDYTSLLTKFLLRLTRWRKAYAERKHAEVGK